MIASKKKNVDSILAFLRSAEAMLVENIYLDEKENKKIYNI
jgi:hypothetical protein|tara:strand:+ start:320677 stop:320799 length:123 start_codon:yes stop_codon:yes gene_type:complete